MPTVVMFLPLAAKSSMSYGDRLSSCWDAIFLYALSERIEIPEPVSIMPKSGIGFCRDSRMQPLARLAHQGLSLCILHSDVMIAQFLLPKYRPCGKCPSRTTIALNLMSTPSTVIAMGTGAIVLTFCIWASLVSSSLGNAVNVSKLSRD